MQRNYISFNKLYLTGNENKYMQDAISLGKLSGGGKYTSYCHDFFEKKYGFRKCLLTNSCTSALEMAAILLEIKEGDEVIVPSYTFVSTANAFLLRGAKVVFADSLPDHPNVNTDLLESLITINTKVIVVVHYAGIACDMQKVMELSSKYDLFVVEDAAQAIDGFYIDSNGKNLPLGSIGHLAAFSFHETKNIISGEGGMLVINDARFIARSEIIWEKGTNRCAFFRGEVDKYRWMDLGSSFLPSELNAAFLWAQLECIDEIQRRRRDIWLQYYNGLKPLEDCGLIKLPSIPPHSTNNAHIFYLICDLIDNRSALINTLKSKNIYSIFHYQSLHNSPYYIEKHDGRSLPNSDNFSDCLTRLPMYYELRNSEIKMIVNTITSEYKKQ